MKPATLCGAGAILLWSLLATGTKLLGRLPPLQVAALSFVCAALVTLGFVAARGRLAALRQKPSAWALGLFGLAGYHAVYFAAFALAPAVEVNLLVYLWPLLIVLLSAPLLGTRLRPRHVLGGLLGFGGCVLAVGGSARFDTAHLAGYALAFAAAVNWGLYSVLSRRQAAVPTDAVAGFCAAAAVVLLALHVAFEDFVAPTPGEWALLAALGAGPLGAGFFLWDIGMKQGDVRLIGTLAYATPVLSTLALVLFGFAPLAWTVALAALLVAAGGLLAARA